MTQAKYASISFCEPFVPQSALNFFAWPFSVHIKLLIGLNNTYSRVEDFWFSQSSEGICTRPWPLDFLEQCDTNVLQHSQLLNLVLNFYFLHCHSIMFVILCVFSLKMHNITMCTDILLIWMAAVRAIPQILVASRVSSCKALHTQRWIKDMKHQPVTLSWENS